MMSSLAGGPNLTPVLDAPHPGWDPRVLVVDDDDVSRLAAAALLRSLGLTVDVASDGRQALAMGAQWPYVAIFMDCLMPDIDGYTAARQLRASDGMNVHTPVIAMTSTSRSVSLASGMDHHLTKPLQAEVLEADCLRLGLLARDGIGPSRSAERRRVEGPLLDPSVFRDLPGDQRARKAKPGVAFIREATARLPELWRATNAGDGSSIARLAVTLRDRATAIGMARVAGVCDRLDQTTLRDATTFAADVEPQLRRALQDAEAAITAYVDAAGADGAGVPVAEPVDACVSNPPSAGPVRVVLADDDPLARIAIGAMLDRADWLELVGDAAGVEEVVELAAVQRPDVVVLDWMMPGGGGREAARRILDRNPDTLVVALTSSDSLELLAEMIAAGASCMVAKGGSAEQLTATIGRALKASAATRAAAAEKRSGRRGIGGGMRSESAPAGESPLDAAGVQRLRSEFGSTGVLADLVALFGSETPARLAEMRSANEAGDAALVSAGAHQLKGGCLTLAAMPMAELCNQLELSAGAGSLDSAAALVDRIESAFASAYAALMAIT